MQQNHILVHFKLKRIVKYGIYYDMIAAFLYFVFNPFFLFYSFFNLLFVYLGLHGLRNHDATYLGSYAIYMFMKIIIMITFFVYICIHHTTYFDIKDANTNNETFIWFCTTYSYYRITYIFM